MIDNYPDIINISDLMTILRISKPTAYNLIKSGKLKSKKIGNSYRIKKEHLKQYLDY